MGQTGQKLTEKATWRQRQTRKGVTGEIYARAHKNGTCADRQTKGYIAKAQGNGMDGHCLEKDTVGSGGDVGQGPPPYMIPGEGTKTEITIEITY